MQSGLHLLHQISLVGSVDYSVQKCDPSRHSNTFSWLKQLGSLSAGGNLLVLLWGVTHGSKSCWKAPSYLRQLRICSEQSLWGQANKSAGELSFHSTKTKIISKQTFPYFAQNIPVCPLKHKKRGPPEELL